MSPITSKSCETTSTCSELTALSKRIGLHERDLRAPLSSARRMQTATGSTTHSRQSQPKDSADSPSVRTLLTPSAAKQRRLPATATSPPRAITMPGWHSYSCKALTWLISWDGTFTLQRRAKDLMLYS